ncbi:ABC transporter ATP-binding protein [Natronoglycomyces albus]|uniref:ABC transporter ATP-binding protein n=1 Tax=Natronoglycomyces albus TaxID=2811108 RepID=A0A895XLP6_9ACTN|nr:ABC transporter ATP-binding protein [Natronoglycomyces albus]QSB04712.1 ABC transporter ATP-binding protein [Natronoglycomyces albus]
MSLLEVNELSVAFTKKNRAPNRAVDGVSFDVDSGEVVGLVGESGCGKSVTSLALMGLLPRRGVDIGGEVSYNGTDLLSISRSRLRDMRGTELAMIFQDPLSSLNPVVPVGLQVTEILKRHRGLKGEKAKKEAAHLLERVGIPDPTRRLKEYPHELSGGMRQRALIAMAVACAPRLMIADEPTTALDVTIQAQILELLKELVDQEGTALLMITHDLGVVAGLCDRVNVLYAGRVVEAAERRDLFHRPTHPYSTGLLGSIPRLDSARGEPLKPIRGSINDIVDWRDGCAFAPRCDRYEMECLQGTPELVLLGAYGELEKDATAKIGSTYGSGREGSGKDYPHRHRCVNPAQPHNPTDDLATVETAAEAVSGSHSDEKSTDDNEEAEA